MLITLQRSIYSPHWFRTPSRFYSQPFGAGIKSPSLFPLTNSSLFPPTQANSNLKYKQTYKSSQQKPSRIQNSYYHSGWLLKVPNRLNYTVCKGYRGSLDCSAPCNQSQGGCTGPAQPAGLLTKGFRSLRCSTARASHQLSHKCFLSSIASLWSSFL